MKFKIKFLEESSGNNLIENDSYIGVYILGLRVKKIRLKNRLEGKEKGNNKLLNIINIICNQIKESNKKKELLKQINKILKTIKVKKIDMDLGINLGDFIVNTYIIAILNSVIPIYLNYSKTDISNIRYNTFISKQVIYLNLKCIIYMPIAKNIVSIIKIIFILAKGGIKNGNKTSNRVVNDNFNDINRKYDRC